MFVITVIALPKLVIQPEKPPIDIFPFRLDQLEKENAVRHQCRRTRSGGVRYSLFRLRYSLLYSKSLATNQSKDEGICEIKVCIMSST